MQFYSLPKKISLALLLLTLPFFSATSYAKTDKHPTEYNVVGNASWYGAELHGRRTVTGKRFSMHEMTAASRALPIGSYAYVTNLSNNKTVVVKITDRGPFTKGRIIDVSYAAAKKLGFINKGVTRVRVQRVKAPPPD